jgi:methyltransferase
MPAASIEIPTRCTVLISVLAAQRLFELWLSHRHLARLESGAVSRSGPARELVHSVRAAGTRADWSAMIAVHAALIVLPLLEVVYFGTSASDTTFWIAVAAYGAAQVVRYWSIASLGSSWNARAVVDSRQACVATGPYRWIRHPNYLAVLIEFSAVPWALGAWRSWIFLNLVHMPVLLRRIRAEERLLAEIPGYREHMLAKGRFLPRLKSHSTQHV